MTGQHSGGAAVALADGSSVGIAERIEVYVNPERDLHGPCVGRAANGDLLLCHQDSLVHQGGDGYVHQWRSRDDGFTWRDEGPAADWRGEGLDALSGEYGTTASGRMVLLVQRRHPRGGNGQIIGSVCYVSDDDGRTWQLRGEIAPEQAHAAMMAREIVRHDSVLLTGMYSRFGHALYASQDEGDSWQRRSVIFPASHPDFVALADAGPPYYPNALFLPGGDLFAVTYITPPVNHCFTTTSADQGRTWGPIAARPDLPVWAPRLGRLDDLLVLTGRDIERHSTVALFSVDSGASWSDPLTVDHPAFEGSYAYTDSLQIAEDRMWVYTSSPRSEGRGDIVGVLLERT